MSAPITVTISGPPGTPKEELASALVDILLLLGATSVSHSVDKPWRGQIHHHLAEANVVVTTTEGK